eukprot:UN24387
MTWIYAQIYQIMSNSTAFDGCQTHYLVWISIQRYVISSWNMGIWYAAGVVNVSDQFLAHWSFSIKNIGNMLHNFPILAVCIYPSTYQKR